MANRRFTQFFNTLHAKPVLLDCNFVVDSDHVDGYGVRSLKGAGIQNVYMHTTATPATGNPNPAAGYAIIQLEDTYNRYFGGFSGFVSPISGTPILVTTGTTAGLAYIIVSVGTTSLAQWQKLGLPVGITPAVGVSFIATATTTATGTGVIEVPKATGSGISSIDIIGDANLTIKSSAAHVAGSTSGAYLIARFLAATNSSTTTLVATAPADESVCGMSFYMGNSSIILKGE